MNYGKIALIGLIAGAAYTVAYLVGYGATCLVIDKIEEFRHSTN